MKAEARGYHTSSGTAPLQLGRVPRNLGELLPASYENALLSQFSGDSVTVISNARIAKRDAAELPLVTGCSWPNVCGRAEHRVAAVVRNMPPKDRTASMIVAPWNDIDGPELNINGRDVIG